MPEEGLICPILTVGTLFINHKKGGAEGFVPCVKDKCALWNGYSSCSLKERRS